MARSSFIRCLFLLLALLVAGRAPALAETGGGGMTVVIVESNATGCQPRCPRWIAASGQIGAETPALFAKVLKQAGRLKLPVLLDSPGGSVDAAIEIGRMIRKVGLDTSVARTQYEGCAPEDGNCKLPPARKGIYRGLASDQAGYCASACPLILASGVSRAASDQSYVGVHQFRTTWTRERVNVKDTLKIANGRKSLTRKVVSREVSQYDTYGIDVPSRKKVEAYLSQMGVSAMLVTEMEKAPFTSLNWLSPARMIELKLITTRQSAAARLDPALCRAALPARNCPQA